jgi:spermidine synthase
VRVDHSPSRGIVFATGGWLGAVQVCVGYALLVAGGASASRYFAFIAVWIGGGALATLAARRPFSRERALNAIFLGGVLSVLTLAHFVLDRWPFSWGSLAAGFARHASVSIVGKQRLSLGLRDGERPALRIAARSRGSHPGLWSGSRREPLATKKRRVVNARRKGRVVLFLVGVEVMLLNYVLIRQLTLSFADPETAALLTGLAYFSGVSLGYLRPEAATANRLRRALPVFLVFQITLMMTGSLLARAITDLAGPWAAYAAVFAITALGSTSLFSVFLPNAIEAEGDGAKTDSATGRLYSIEIAGSLFAIVALVALSRLGAMAVHALYFGAFVAIAALVGSPTRSLVFMASLSVATLVGYDAADKTFAAVLYRRSSGIDRLRVIATTVSPYHKIEVLEADPGRRMLVLDGKLQFEGSMHDGYSYFVAEYPARLLGRPVTCVLGCGSMSTVGRIGRIAESVQIVDIDRRVFETSKEFFPTFNHLEELDNWSFVDDDAKHFLGTSSRTFDLIIDDIPPAKSRQIALTYTREFFALVRARLSPRGLFSIPTLVSVSSTTSTYGRRVLSTLAHVFEQVFVIDYPDASYCFATSRALRVDEETLRTAIDHPGRDSARIVLDPEARALTEGIAPVSIGDVHALMLE